MNAKVAIIMGSHSDWETMKEAELILKDFGVSVHKEIVSAHRSPELMLEFSKNAKQAGYSVIIAGAGGAAHLPGMVASMTTLPVLGVPVQSKALNGMDSLLSIVQMPGGVPVGTLAIGTAGAKNAGLLALRILSLQSAELSEKLEQYRIKIREEALSKNKDLL
ncbi:5-(carboxyamino)imidazole ribonucleotide mutase [Leptospira yasudae]|uniref:N5-carboxyaminoimidazole ribonucleotide mutase n=1 Tax=Leptospira yasudae TaxID=2202201 RepID=A0A6N4QNL1_9LEPT|nr:5-(carboxyamino)imidazole ribonucleotide mutase [Leptospira yasudae]TGL76842.1 5-(carboxyamino)imidazole ribonucleotide mutase [Leptospira yasudae]TGL79632.1 5-(carboxyamino)imidazole ribonucleotide mutase [Leptospira yasudae]TGL82794.1 5-(carboxyamino)imidazole ribonucleotide mutase [Leptospira yasudae]